MNSVGSILYDLPQHEGPLVEWAWEMLPIVCVSGRFSVHSKCSLPFLTVWESRYLTNSPSGKRVKMLDIICL